MKLYEYQAKEVFKEEGIAIPNSVLISEYNQLENALSEIGTPCVVKSQVLSGGRGKAGLVVFTPTEEKAKAETKRLFEHELSIKNIMIDTNDGIFNGVITFYVDDYSTLDNLITKIREENELIKVRRLDEH